MKGRRYTPTDEQKQAAEHRRARLRDLATAVSKLPDTERARFAAMHPVVTCEGRILSVFNQCFAAMQNPAVTMVGGFRQWLKQGRHVRKGEKGMAIWVPKGAKSEAAGDGPAVPALCDISALDVADGNGADGAQREGCRFILATVFDVMQTDEKAAEIKGGNE